MDNSSDWRCGLVVKSTYDSYRGQGLVPIPYIKRITATCNSHSREADTLF